MRNDTTLLLSQGYAPLKIIPWQKAVTLFSLQKVEVIETYSKNVRSSSVSFKMPAVVRLVRTFKRIKKPVKFSRANIYARDNYECQYCLAVFPSSGLTYDHVVPKSQGGQKSWTNIVTCCGGPTGCNIKKGGRTPRQAGMTLHKVPSRPAWVPPSQVVGAEKVFPAVWKTYLY